MRKVAVFCLTVIMALSLLAGSALAFTVTFTDYTGNTQYTGNVDGVYAAALIDADSGTILFQKNIDETIEPASTTKIMTLILALENGNMSDVVTVSSNAAGQSGSKIMPEALRAGEKIVFEDLINGMMLASGNEAAVAIAEHIGGSVDGFVAMMNAKAAELGMTGTQFTVPHGLHAEGHHTTARDMAILTLYALQNPQLVQIVKQTSYTMVATNLTGARVVENTNALLQPDSEYYYAYATGIKTGCTPKAGDCLVSSASKDGMNLICLVFNAGFEQTTRWTVTKSLFDWGFDNFSTVDLTTLLGDVDPIQATVENAVASDSGLLEFARPEAGSVYVTLDKTTLEAIQNDPDSITAEPVYNTETLEAPIAKNDLLGTVSYKIASTGQVIYTANLIAPRDVAELGSEPNASGATAVETQAPILPPNVVTKKDSALVWLWLLIPAGLVAFLVIRLLTVNKHKRKRFKRRQPHYSYRIKKH